MRPEPLYLKDIRRASKDVIRFVGDSSFEDFASNDILLSAVIFKLMTIGEAASHISRGIRSRHTDVDWRAMIGFRNILVHEYFALDAGIIYRTASAIVGPLADKITYILEVEYPEFSSGNDNE